MLAVVGIPSRKARPPGSGEDTLSPELRTAGLLRPHVWVGYQWSHTGFCPGETSQNRSIRSFVSQPPQTRRSTPTCSPTPGWIGRRISSEAAGTHLSRRAGAESDGPDRRSVGRDLDRQVHPGIPPARVARVQILPANPGGVAGFIRTRAQLDGGPPKVLAVRELL